MGSKASEKKRGFFNAIKPDTMWQDEFPIVIKGALHPNPTHNVCTVHVANDFMSSNISAPNHVNNVKGGN